MLHFSWENCYCFPWPIEIEIASGDVTLLLFSMAHRNRWCTYVRKKWSYFPVRHVQKKQRLSLKYPLDLCASIHRRMTEKMPTDLDWKRCWKSLDFNHLKQGGRWKMMKNDWNHQLVMPAEVILTPSCGPASGFASVSDASWKITQPADDFQQCVVPWMAVIDSEPSHQYPEYPQL